jgi:tight adherence protein B
MLNLDKWRTLIDTRTSWVIRRLRRQRQRDAQLAVYADYLGRIRAELRAGAVPVDAVISAGAATHVAASNPRFGNPFQAVGLSMGDVAVVRALNCCAAAWESHHARGLALEPLIAVAEQTLRDARELRLMVDEETASVRASSRMLMFLPLISPLFGLSMGCDPWAWLFGTPLGWMTFAAGFLLVVANIVSTAFIVTRATA